MNEKPRITIKRFYPNNKDNLPMANKKRAYAIYAYDESKNHIIISISDIIPNTLRIWFIRSINTKICARYYNEIMEVCKEELVKCGDLNSIKKRISNCRM